MGETPRDIPKNGGARWFERLANHAALALASRLAMLIVAGLLTFLGGRFVAALDKVTADAAELSKNVAVIATRVNGHERRIDRLETKVFP